MTLFTVKNHSTKTSAACRAEASFARIAARSGACASNSIIAILDAILVASIFVALVLGLSALLGLALITLLVLVSLISLLVLLGQVYLPKEQPRP